MTVNSESISVTLVVPGLLRLQDKEFRDIFKQVSQQLQRLPALELILSRGEHFHYETKDFESTLFELFHLTKADSGDFPIGALSHYLQTGDVTQSWYMRADPVYMQPNRDHLLLLGNEMIDISIQEAERLVDDVNKTYLDTPWQMKMLSTRQWVIEMQEATSLQTHPLFEVTGKNISDYLPQGKDAASWHALLNELQMLLHSHPVNREREMKGLATVNSVWFWGVGQLPKIDNNIDHQEYVQCWSHDSTALALARLCKVPRVDLPGNGDTWLQQAITPGRHLLVIDELNMPMGLIEPYDWWQSLKMVEEQWLQPLQFALQKGRIANICLVCDNGQRYDLTRSMSKHWWKRVKALV